MFHNLNNELIKISNDCQNKLTPILLINKQLDERSKENGVKRNSHPILWERNKRKILRNSVSFKIIKIIIN